MPKGISSMADIVTADRLTRLGYKPVSARKPLAELDGRGKLLVEYMSSGLPQKLADVASRIGVTPGQPLTIEQAADILHIRRRNARWISRQAVFQKALAGEVEAIRSGAKIRAVRKLAELVDEPGEGSAADRKVQMQAATAILGEQAKGPGFTVNTSIYNGVTLQAGIVVRLPAGTARAPLEIDDEPAGAAITLRPNFPATEGN
jgi:hypothetical protein